MKAHEILRNSAQHIEDRATARDQPQGERSMRRTVESFNALTGHQLSERDGWLFMVQLKAARACCTPHGTRDDYEDGASYFALAGECVSEDSASVPTHYVADDGAVLKIPEGMNWVAQDSDGSWWAYEEEPIKTVKEWRQLNDDSRYEQLSDLDPIRGENWDSTLAMVRA
jgi:hypothetical protein